MLLLCMFEFGVFSSFSFKFTPVTPCFRLTESQRKNIDENKRMFFFLSFRRVNLFKNKSVFFPVRSALVLKSGTVQGNIHLRTASNERKKNVNLSR